MTTIEQATRYTCQMCAFASDTAHAAAVHGHNEGHAVRWTTVTRYHHGSNEWAAIVAELHQLGERLIGVGQDETGWWFVTIKER